jgi:nicotinamidase-related amidase
MSRRALLLIDFQADFLDTRGRMPVNLGHVQPLITATRRAINEARLVDDLIVKLANEFRPKDVIGNLIRHHAAIQGSPGTIWDRRVDPPGALYIAKWEANAFCNPELVTLLEDAHVSEVCLAGLYARACVTATAKSAHQRGFAVRVIGDATACRSDRSRRRALDRLRRAGIEVL